MGLSQNGPESELPRERVTGTVSPGYPRLEEAGADRRGFLKRLGWGAAGVLTLAGGAAAVLASKPLPGDVEVVPAEPPPPDPRPADPRPADPQPAGPQPADPQPFPGSDPPPPDPVPLPGEPVPPPAPPIPGGLRPPPEPPKPAPVHPAPPSSPAEPPVDGDLAVPEE
jgi:hypothetical protein